PGGAARLTLRGHAGPVWAVAFARDGSLLATAGEDGSVRFWDPQNGTSRGVASLPCVNVHAVALCPTQPRVALGGEAKLVRVDDTAKLWSAADGHLHATPTGHKARVMAVAFAPDGKKLASASRDGTAKVWDTQRRQELATLAGHKGHVAGVAWSPDGLLLVSV